MKTAMQELLGLVEQMFNNADALKLELPASMLNDIINIITQEGLQKEKEQIEQSYLDGNIAGRDRRRTLNYYEAKYILPNQINLDGK